MLRTASNINYDAFTLSVRSLAALLPVLVSASLILMFIPLTKMIAYVIDTFKIRFTKYFAARAHRPVTALGFTIIEVLIVLAIAGLILLIVFLAVPALQRNSRNTQRRTEAARLLAVVQENINNNGGALPNSASGFVSTSCAGTGNAAGKCDYTTTPNIAMQIWQLGNLKNIDGFTVQPAGTVAVQTPVLTPATATEAILDTGVKCGALNAGQTAFTPTTTGATIRSLVIYYAIEDQSGSPIAQCTSS